MENSLIYQDIANRTQGDIYIGVVGPVRTGKSTFIKRFMDLIVIPNIDNDYKRERAMDELPQSADGKTIMTTEPKFIPNEAVTINLGDNATLNVRMIDCVGYIVKSALGHSEDGNPRMVSTPWFEEDIPFNEAAEIGTQKVINEHSTIGLLVTTDGSICGIDRDEYIDGEERAVRELKEINKPFIILLNSKDPDSEETQNLRTELEEKYKVPTFALSCTDLSEDDIKGIIENILFEFPISEMTIDLPHWIDALDVNHYIRKSIFDTIKANVKNIKKISDSKPFLDALFENEYIEDAKILNMELGNGNVNISLRVPNDLFYKVLGETTGLEIDNEEKLIEEIIELSKIKKDYDTISYAIDEARRTGYGIVSPTIDDMTLEKPQMVKQGGRYGVKLSASAPSLHIIRADIETEVSPIVGSEKQSEDLVHYLLSEFEGEPGKIWESNIFGKSLHELVNEGLHTKLSKMPEDARFKIQETLTRIINEGSGGLICIIL